jgi:hypothetical protein
VNGEVVGTGDDSSISSGNYKFQFAAGTVIYGLQTLDLAKGAPAAAPPQPAPGPEQWVDLLQKYFALPADQQKQGAVEQVPEGARLNARAAFNLPSGARQNAALRVSVRGLKESFLLVMRVTSDAGGKNLRTYQASLNTDGFGRIIRRDSSQSPAETELRRYGPIPGFVPDARHTFEFRAVDDMLTVILDGQAFEPVRDAALTKGGMSLTGDPGMIIEKVEVADLTSLKAAGAVTPSSVPTITGWVNVMDEAKAAIQRLGVGVTDLKEEDGWLVATQYKKYSGTGLGNKDYRDMAVRGRVRNGGNVQVRSEKPGYYMVQLGRSGRGAIVPSGRPDIIPFATFSMSAEPEHSFLITMTGPDIRVWVDEKFVAFASDTRFSLGKPGIAMPGEGSAFRDLEVAELPPDFASKLPPIAATSSSAADEKWTDATAAKRARNYFDSGIGAEFWVDDGRELRWRKYAAFDVTLKAVRDSVTRVTWIPKPDASIHIRTFKPAKGYSFYALDTPGNGTLTLRHVNDETNLKETLKTMAYPPGIDPNGEQTIEIRAVGSVISVAVNGQTLGTVNDAGLEQGTTGILGEPGLVVKKVEYAVLDGATNPAPPAGAGAPAAADEK